MSAQEHSGWEVALVDDDDSLRRALARAIRLAGYKVRGYASTEELLAAGVPKRNACLVLDVGLPGASGIDCRQMLAVAGNDLPTIFITALERGEVGEALAALAPVAVLYKPFRNEELIEAIGRCRLAPNV